MQLTNQQQQVLVKIKEFMESEASVFILCGYAGTGKTTMIKVVADYISQARQVALMAPTGRAARVLHLKTGYVTSTIHKAIYGSASFQTKEVKDIAASEFKLFFPIAQTDGSVVAIVDESSMISTRTQEQELMQYGTDNLMNDLLTYVRPSFGGKVIFVGDPAQLPPIGDNTSHALCADYFKQRGLEVMQAELTEVLRQTGESVILKNAMQIRGLLARHKRNKLVFEERENDVVTLPSDSFLKKYLEERRLSGQNDCVVICFSNQSAAEYNKEIRSSLYGEDNPLLREGDILLVVHNNYQLDRMNGEFVPVLSVGKTIRQSAPVYIQEKGQKVKKTITLEFVQIKTTDATGAECDCMLLLDLLNNGQPSVSIDEQRALYINFCMRNPNLKQGSESFSKALLQDVFFNCLKAKYGYSVTGHKCQGGEWSKVFVDYRGRTGLSDDCLRWAYTATTRAKKTLYVSNLPHITPFSKFRIEPIQQCSKINEECRILENIKDSPYHNESAPDYLKAKWRCISTNMEWSPYKINGIISRPYQEIYTIQTPDGIERYDLRYKKGGIFLKAVPQSSTEHTYFIQMMLDNERAMPFIFNYSPSESIFGKLLQLIRSSCDGLNIQMTNVVEHKEDYSIMFYFRTSNTMSYIKIYVDKNAFVTYAKPMSLVGKEDHELQLLIEEIQNHFV